MRFFPRLEEELGAFRRGQSSKGLRFLALVALRVTGEAGASSGSSTTMSREGAGPGAASTIRFVRLVEGGVAR